MEELRTLETPVLVDMLVTYTADYTKMLNEGGSKEEFEKCKLTLKAIQAEIDFRKHTYDSASMTQGDTSITGNPN